MLQRNKIDAKAQCDRPIVVLGATGTVGGAVLDALSRCGVEIRAVARRVPGAAGREATTVGWLVADLAVPSSLDRALAGAGALFLLTPLEEAMPERVAAVAARARAAGIDRVVRLSAYGAGTAQTLLGRVHREAEQAVLAAGLEMVALRPNGFMQNYVTQLGHGIRAHGLITSPQGSGAVSLVDARDVAAVAAACLTGAPAPVDDLTGPVALDEAAVAACISRVSGRAVRYQPTSMAAAARALADIGLPAWLRAVILDLYALSADGGAARVTAAVEAVLGRPPARFEDFARHARAHWMAPAGSA
ncbi:MAG: NAD(P)H-binding protein [Ectothiorhodospiraceae bacterium]|nr:NAD(P)H-binding protein [Ectothiorhodospiraceae bacterium]